MITLASASPRRRTLLEALFQLRVAPVTIDERPRPEEDPVDYARRMAQGKCQGEGDWILSADTVVHDEGRIYNKPVSAQDAVQILLALSGRMHRVTTAFALNGVVAAVTSKVVFRRLTMAEIEAYVATGEPMDKAGAYGIQGIGGFLVERIEGSYSNIVGLPLAEVIESLRLQGGPAPFEARHS